MPEVGCVGVRSRAVGTPAGLGKEQGSSSLAGWVVRMAWWRVGRPGACSAMQRRRPRDDVGMWPDRLQKLDC